MTDFWRCCFLIFALTKTVALSTIFVPAHTLPKCFYGERGSLTATCINATATTFKITPYRFDHLDETLRCIHCQLQVIDTGTFDLSGNQILTLDLTNSKIRNIRPKAFIGLVFLETLILSNNDIQEIVPGVFTGVKKIRVLELRDNSISSLFADAFIELERLERLSLLNNKINNITPGAFNGLKNLVELDLGQNQITFIKGIFNDLPKIEIIYLDHNNINALLGDEFENLPSLKELHLSENKITTIPSGEFRAMPNLEILDLSENSIQSIMPGSFISLESLETLDLSNNQLKMIPRKVFFSLFSIRDIDLSFNNLNTFQTATYTGLPELRSLNLSNNQITAIHVNGIFSLESLHTLDLSSNKIGDFHYKKLIRKLPRISFLNLANNNWPCFLEKEMDEYFDEDNFKFLLYDESSKSPKCLDIPRSQSQIAEDVVAVSAVSATVWASILLVIVMFAIAVLFYMQYRVYRSLQ